MVSRETFSLKKQTEFINKKKVSRETKENAI
jgi:hypothetical protein